MAKKSRKKSRARRKGGNPQRAKFKAAAKKCQAQIRDAGVIAFSREQWKTYGSCMKKAL
jgi:hypothetical protein